MKKLLILTLALITGFAMTLHAQATLTPDKIPLMSIEELKRQIDNPDFMIVDVRSSHDWEDSTTKIKGSIREDASNTTNWIAKYPPNKTIVFYCA
jgi:rhodanese-related sulfurtransferase